MGKVKKTLKTVFVIAMLFATILIVDAITTSENTDIAPLVFASGDGDDGGEPDGGGGGTEVPDPCAHPPGYPDPCA